MKLKELKEIINSFSEEYDDVEVFKLSDDVADFMAPKRILHNAIRLQLVSNLSPFTNVGRWTKDTPVDKTYLFIN